MPSETVQLTSAAAQLRADGVAVLRGVFSDWVTTLQAGVERNMAEPGPHVRHYTPDGQAGYFFGDYCNWQRIAEYREFVERSKLGQVAAELMGARQVSFFHEHVLVKEPNTGEPTPWHHDYPYYSVDCAQTASFWIPLDSVAANVCPEFIRGSHQWGKWYVPTRFTGQEWERGLEPQGLERIPDIDSRREEFDIVSFDLEPGDAVVFDFLTVHGAPPNSSATRRRRAFSARVLGDNPRWAVRSGPTSPPFPELSGTLSHGDSLDGIAQFPIIHG